MPYNENIEADNVKKNITTTQIGEHSQIHRFEEIYCLSMDEKPDRKRKTTWWETKNKN